MSTRQPRVPHRLDDAVARQPLIDVAADRALIRFPGVGRLLVDADGIEQRQPDPGCHTADLDFLGDTSTAMAALLSGRFSLRASVVSVHGRGIAICGIGPSGKSTTAAALALQGHPVVADALATIDVSGADPIVSPQPGGLLLWPDTAERLGLDLREGQPIRRALAVRRFEFETCTEPVPLAAVLVMRDDPGDVYEIERQRGFDAVDDIKRVRWHGWAIQPLEFETAAFWWTTRVAGVDTVAHLITPRSKADTSRVVEMILESVGVT